MCIRDRSKPIFIAGPQGWRDSARKLGVELVLRVDVSGKVQVTQALRQRLESKEEMETVE